MEKCNKCSEELSTKVADAKCGDVANICECFTPFYWCVKNDCAIDTKDMDAITKASFDAIESSMATYKTQLEEQGCDLSAAGTTMLSLAAASFVAFFA